MALFPKIQSPCPYKDNLAAVMDGDFCRRCKRQVVDLTAMTDGERIAFLGGCKSEVCVSYRLRPAIAAAAFIAATVAPAAAAACEATEIVIITGGIKDPSAIEYVENAADRAIPDLPVVYEADAPSVAAKDGGKIAIATPLKASAPL